jgi:hypothetical protein
VGIDPALASLYKDPGDLSLKEGQTIRWVTAALLGVCSQQQLQHKKGSNELQELLQQERVAYSNTSSGRYGWPSCSLQCQRHWVASHASVHPASSPLATGSLRTTCTGLL